MLNKVTERELITILDSTHDGMIAVNGEGIITIFNRAAERITGLRADNVIGHPAVDVIPNTRLNIVLASGEPELNQQQTVANAVILTNRVPIRDGAGRISGAAAIFRDITEISSLTGQVSDLRQARSLLEAIIEATSDAISVADEHGNTIIVNPAYTRITGLPKSAVIDKPVTVDIAEGESMHMKVLRTGEPVRNVHMKVGPLKKEVVVHVSPLFIDGAVKGSVGIIHDISEIMALTAELARAKKILRRLEARYTWDDIIGTSAVILAIKEQARRAAETPATVLLRGESGIGKELFAHAIHHASSRGSGQFVSINCAAIAEGLLESELFGYEEGAFTGALRGGRKGLFEEANGGTIFLDEIGEIGPPLQSKLLRVLQEREVTRVGSGSAVPVNVRVIAATNANLEQKIRAGVFREDLYYRLNVIPLHIPPLRERKEDIAPIAEHIINTLNQEFGRMVEGITPEAVKALVDYRWPGNVRELENFLGRAMINMLPREKIMGREHLPSLDCEGTVNYSAAGVSIAQPLAAALAEAEKLALLKALKETGDNREKAAVLLGISVRSLYYKIGKLGLK